ncbi:MAG: alpha-amylase, partial [Oscillibacter sp.]|nr:alpha-amylase [Oscillibacter sp.]
DQCGQVMRLFDVPLHFQFHRLSTANGSMDLRDLFRGTLTAARPDQAVSFVDNHDTQPGQALQSWVADWCKPLAYACILLRREGVPCVFYGDLYGIPHSSVPPVEALPKLLLARKFCAHGQQTDYLDDPDTIGWVRRGTDSAMAVVLSDGPGGSKRMCTGAEMSGAVFVDLLGGRNERILIPENGTADFPVNGGSAAVWVPENMAEQIQQALKSEAVPEAPLPSI